MLHGHCHGAYVNKSKYILDVGVVTHNYMPRTIDEIEAEMASRNIVLRNHHEPVAIKPGEVE